MIKIIFFVSDWINAWMKSSWCTIALFCIASARKYFSNCTDAVSDQLFVWSFIYISSCTHILAFKLSRPPYGFSFVLKAHFTGITSLVGSAFSFISKVSLSTSPVISCCIAVPHFSLMNVLDFRNLLCLILI